MEQLLLNLLAADSEVINKATAELQEAYKRPETILQLCELVVSSKQPQIRQYAAILLRKRLAKLRVWQKLPEDQQVFIKQGMLNALLKEEEKIVRNAIAQLIGIMIKHDFNKKDAWMNEVLQFVFEHCCSPDLRRSELGSSTLAILIDVAPDQFVPHLEALCEIFTAAMMTTTSEQNMSPTVIYNILIGMGHLVPFILGHNSAENTYQKLLPYVVKALQVFASTDPVMFVKAFDVLENLADYAPTLLSSNLKVLLNFCLEAASNEQLDGAVRVKCVAYIGCLVRLKKNIIIKQKLIEPIIHVIFNLMATHTENDDDEEYFLGEDESNPMTTATQTMDLLALHLPPEKLIPPLLQLLEPALKGTNPLPKKAAYLCMAVIAEGCSEAICQKYLSVLLEIVKIGITDQCPLVRNAAFFTLGQFSEHLQPDITKYAPEILPILFHFLQQLCNELKAGAAEPKHIDRMFYALETFCENLEESLVPHLPILMERLFEALDSKNSVRLRELALSAVSAAANASKSNMMPYFPTLIEGLKSYLMKDDGEDACALRPQAIDTLATIARTIGKENFLPLSNDTMSYALNLLDSDDPDIRRALYNLIASISEVVNEEMAPVLPRIIDRMLLSVQSTEEVMQDVEKPSTFPVPTECNDENGDIEIDIELSDGEDDSTDNIVRYNVENAYIDEKEEAILALKEIAEHSGKAFIPYLHLCYENVYKVIDHPQDDIRKVSIDALTSFIIALHKQSGGEGVTESASMFIPKLTNIIQNDEECTVVITALEACAELLREIKHLAISSEKTQEMIFNCISQVMNNQVACQFSEVTGCDDDQEESEYDEAIIEAAGNLLPLFGLALHPDQFATYFERMFPVLVKKIEKTRIKELDSQRCFAYGALSECFKPLQKHSAKYFESLLPVLLAGAQDKNESVRQNSIFGLGELVLYSEEKSYKNFPEILANLSKAVSNEKHQGVLDNICGAIARLILTNYKLVPLEHVLPVFFQNLPLKDDFDENNAVIKSLNLLLTHEVDALLGFIEKTASICLHLLHKKEAKDDETKENSMFILKVIREKFYDKLMTVLNSDPEIAHFAQTL